MPGTGTESRNPVPGYTGVENGFTVNRGCLILSGRGLRRKIEVDVGVGRFEEGGSSKVDGSIESEIFRILTEVSEMVAVKTIIG